jgi:phospholipase C
MSLPPIEHVVVLMFENRSFDHVFGALPGVDGVLDGDGNVNPDYYNLPDPTQPPSDNNAPVYPKGIKLDDQHDEITHDFNHDYCDGMMTDLFGPSTAPGLVAFLNGQNLFKQPITFPPTNCGFISSLYYPPNEQHPTPIHGPIVVQELPFPDGPSAMTYFESGSLPVLHGLAQQFVVCDNWFCDMPGHTKANRLFMHCAQTGNLGIVDDEKGVCDSKTIFQLIGEHGKTWKIYAPCPLLSDARFLSQIQNDPCGAVPIHQFAEDIKSSETMPFYSFLMCWSGDTRETESSMHPAARMQPGENYLAAVYNALLNSPVWNQTLLIVTFDENGGLYDHVMPPTVISPVPGSSASETYHNITAQFDFTLLGLRVPALLISPWLAPGIDKTQYRNTSILHFLEYLMTGSDPPGAWLTYRDFTALNITSAFTQFGLTKARTNCPTAPHHRKYPFAGGLSDFVCKDTEVQHEPAAHWSEVQKIYGVEQS